MQHNATEVDEATYTNEYHNHSITLCVGDVLANNDGETSTINAITRSDVSGHKEPLTEIQLSTEDESTAIHTLEAAIRKGNVAKVN